VYVCACVCLCVRTHARLSIYRCINFYLLLLVLLLQTSGGGGRLRYGMTAADVAPTDERRTSGVVEPESQPSSRPSSRPGSAHGGYGGTGGDSSRYFEHTMFRSTWRPKHEMRPQ